VVKETILIEIADFIRERSSGGELTAPSDLEARFGDSVPNRVTGDLDCTLPGREAQACPQSSVPRSKAPRGQALSPQSSVPETLGDLILDAVSSHDDIQVVKDDAGSLFYYSDRFMTGAYAGILALKGRGPFRMMAEVVREHSRIYPRPVPAALFRCTPFDLDDDLISQGLEEMTKLAPYRDIAQLTTSTGNVFLYSTDYLDRDYAAMLAEWVDVGQAENP